MLQEIQQVATLCATLVGIGIAANGLSTWKREVVGKRDMEFCQKLIEIFYEAQAKFAALRDPFSFHSEATGREPREHETEDETRHLDTTYGPIARYNSQVEFWSSLSSLRWRAKATLGPQAEAPFKKIDRAVSQYRVAAAARYRAAFTQQPLPQHLQSKYDDAVWDGSTDPDPLTDLISEAIADMEAICIPNVRPLSLTRSIWQRLQRPKTSQS